eukprot:CAMPEP_0184077912 /NCGR_PEP_ID=MMETSP0974-20121125/903_1 /TAXON_ID=483370 /ORGANISM="non described non described, Strain CCMP2097" /LENGTH=73 /DNA_ID=CAMNT_0026380507 /DNA_START=314 /DNA_END=532 /DNA_ORIENTATION=+
MTVFGVRCLFDSLDGPCRRIWSPARKISPDGAKSALQTFGGPAGLWYNLHSATVHSNLSVVVTPVIKSSTSSV